MDALKTYCEFYSHIRRSATKILDNEMYCCLYLCVECQNQLRCYPGSVLTCMIHYKSGVQSNVEIQLEIIRLSIRFIIYRRRSL